MKDRRFPKTRVYDAVMVGKVFAPVVNETVAISNVEDLDMVDVVARRFVPAF